MWQNSTTQIPIKRIISDKSLLLGTTWHLDNQWDVFEAAICDPVVFYLEAPSLSVRAWRWCKEMKWAPQSHRIVCTIVDDFKLRNMLADKKKFYHIGRIVSSTKFSNCFPSATTLCSLKQSTHFNFVNFFSVTKILVWEEEKIIPKYCIRSKSVFQAYHNRSHAILMYIFRIKKFPSNVHKITLKKLTFSKK